MPFAAFPGAVDRARDEVFCWAPPATTKKNRSSVGEIGTAGTVGCRKLEGSTIEDVIRGFGWWLERMSKSARAISRGRTANG